MKPEESTDNEKVNNQFDNTHIIALDQDHPGFRDKAYRKQRDEIARKAKEFRTARLADKYVKVQEINYTPAQHEIWAKVYENVARFLDKNVVKELVDAFYKTNFPKDRIPRFEDVNNTLAGQTGIQLVPVEGLAHPRDFFGSLAKGEFFCTQYIRHSSRPDFTPEPDICHDMFGHVQLLMSDKITNVQKTFAKAALICPEEDLPSLEKIYWFTFEYGLCMEDGKVKTYGAGNISSFADIQRCVDPKQIEHIPFDIEVISKTSYDPTIQQPCLYVADSLDYALEEIERFLTERYGVKS